MLNQSASVMAQKVLFSWTVFHLLTKVSWHMYSYVIQLASLWIVKHYLNCKHLKIKLLFNHSVFSWQQDSQWGWQQVNWGELSFCCFIYISYPQPHPNLQTCMADFYFMLSLPYLCWLTLTLTCTWLAIKEWGRGALEITLLANGWIRGYTQIVILLCFFPLVICQIISCKNIILMYKCLY